MDLTVSSGQIGAELFDLGFACGEFGFVLVLLGPQLFAQRRHYAGLTIRIQRWGVQLWACGGFGGLDFISYG
ncbi:hypothetical protein [Mycobacterium intracellulare]|uniref:hypothetical protein n=1 Tax=Mycobacterium intracellulare TaxID=1767 RepID=UPI001EED9D0C|nr:hypothetical protein [Mycobacterium intracellulare]MEE3755319.1 hypothetical protein [Mycobacterium intracellulare]